MSSGERRTTSITGPTVFAIGWIPYRRLIFSRLPPAYVEKSAWSSWSAWKKWAALKGVFWTGNDPPPAAFNGYEDLQRYILSKDYRAIVGFRDVSFALDDSGMAQLEFDRIGRPKRPDVEEIYVGGYTRFRLPFGIKSIYRTNIKDFDEGYELRLRSFSRVPDRRMLPLATTINFRVGDYGNRKSKELAGHEAPFAFTECSYKLHVNGDYEVAFSGSPIPSQSIYVNWKLVHQYSMENISNINLKNFLTADTEAKFGRPRQIPLYSARGNVRDLS